MYRVKRILGEVASTSSRNEKEAILTKYKEERLLKYILWFIYNPHIVTGIARKKLSKLQPTKVTDLEVIDVMDYIMEHNTGRDEDIQLVVDFIASEPSELRELYEKIFTKSLKIGVTGKTLCKIYGEEFNFEFPIMKAHNYFDYADRVSGREFSITQKLDGNRAVLCKDSKGTTIFSSNGKSVSGAVEIEKEAAYLPSGFAYDGELLAVNKEGWSREERFRQTGKILRSKGEKTGLEFHVFDIIPLDEFWKKSSRSVHADRRIILGSAVENNPNLSLIQYVPALYIGQDISMIDYYFQKAIEAGDEGIMVNLSDSCYKAGRGYEIFKVKAERTIDLRIIGFEAGKAGGKYENTLGAIIVNYKGGKVRVGTMPEEVRFDIWKNRENYLGTIVEIKYTEEICDETGEISLRFPRFKCFRWDKSEESYD